jgi:hypothetical protein
MFFLGRKAGGVTSAICVPSAFMVWHWDKFGSTVTTLMFRRHTFRPVVRVKQQLTPEIDG